MLIKALMLKTAILAVGIAIGAVAIVLSRPSPTQLPNTSTAAKGTPFPSLTGSSAELGSNILQAVGRNLIADNRATRSSNSPLLLYSKAKPYGEALCRVDVYTVAPKIVREPIIEREKWDDDLKVERLYGLWKQPSLAGGDSNRACAAYRDFDHLIREGSILSAARAAFVLDKILVQAKTGKFGFKISCIKLVAEFNARPISCDPVAMLRLLTLKDIFYSEQKSEIEGERSYIRQDKILVAGSRLKAALKVGTDLLVEINVEDEQHFGSQSIDEADVRWVKIEISEVG